MSGEGILPSTSRFKGTAEECLHDLLKRHGKNGVDMVVEHAGYSHGTVVQWKNGVRNFQSQGHRLCRLICLLLAAGYSVKEYEGLSAEYKKLLLIVGLNVTSPQRLYQELGYSSPQRPSDVQGLWRILSGRGAYGGSQLSEVINRYQDVAGERLTTLAETVGGLKTQETKANPTPTPKNSNELDPGLPVAFSHLASTLTSLGLVIERQGGDRARPAIQEATSGGIQLRELRDLLNRLIGDE